VNKGGEEQVFACEDEEQALDKGLPWVMQGYITRIADERGVVKWTQAVSDGQICLYKADTTQQRSRSGAQGKGGRPASSSTQPWWRFS
jgi:hypothetical protein